jgi:Kelch motif protein
VSGSVGSRLRRQGPPVAGAVAGLLLVLAFLAAFGPPLPGPSVSKLLGLEEGSSATPCRPDARYIREPSPPPSGRWRQERPSPLARAEVKGALAGSSLYLIGGQGNGGGSVSSVIRFDPRRDRYQRVADLPTRLDHAGVAANGSNVYVVGGYINSRPTNKVWRYSTATRHWTQLRPLRIARGGLGAVVIGDRLYAVGGGPSTYPNVRAKPYGTLEVLDLRSGRWSFGPDMPTPRHHLAATALGGMLYVIGGRAPTDFSLAAVERYEPSRERWQRLVPLPQGVGGAEALAAGGRILVAGGDDEEGLGDGGGWVTPAAWSLRPGDSRWRRLPDLSQARHGHASAAFGGRLYVFEGSPCPGYGRARSAESLPVPGS